MGVVAGVCFLDLIPVNIFPEIRELLEYGGNPNYKPCLKGIACQAWWLMPIYDPRDSGG